MSTLSPSNTPPKTPAPRPRAAGVTLGRSEARRDQLIAGALAVVLLAGAIALQPIITQQRKVIVRDPRESNETVREASLRNLAIEFPRLTLGGFRGLLAMVLWLKAEDAKNERQWMQLETAYNYIGVLQPYFVTVYIFHAWNQAYNLSAQWHDQDQKYKWVLDGLDYLYKGEAYNPGNADIMLEEANMYFLKIGGSFERIFYRAHWRDDLSRLHELIGREQLAQTDDATATLMRVRDFARRPEFNIELLPDPSGKTTRTGYGIRVRGFLDPKDKSDRTALDFPYGVSPYYFAYKSFQRTLAVPTPPTTTGLNVIDAWPAMSLRLWCRDDIYHATGLVGEMFTKVKPEEAMAQKDFGRRVAEIRRCYENVPLVAPRAVSAFQQHLAVYKQNLYVHTKHIYETQYYQALAAAEQANFEALYAWLTAGRKVTPVVTERFADAEAKYVAAQDKLRAWIKVLFPNENEPNPDRADYEKYGQAIQSRIEGLRTLAAVAKAEDVNFGFLREETVEK